MEWSLAGMPPVVVLQFAVRLEALFADIANKPGRKELPELTAA
jgi:hypothetical protein